MTARLLDLLSFSSRLRASVPSFAALLIGAVLAACGGSADAPPPPPASGSVVAVPPTIMQHPQPLTVTVGQPASFSVAATGTQPIGYQWQRNGTAIAGATSTTYAIAATALADSGATFLAVASNVAGSATSNSATLTVSAAAPVLTITQQPASVSVAAGAQASFSVAATCSSGTLAIRWQRSPGTGVFADVAGATSATYAFAAAQVDSGAQIRAALDCSGQAATTSNVATLTVTAPASATLSLYPLNNLRDQALVTGATVIDQLADGSAAFFVGSRLMRLAADRSTITPIAGTQQGGYTDGPGATAQFNQPFGLTHDATGVIYVSDRNNNVIRRVALDGTVSTIAGSAGQSGNSDGSGSAARFDEPRGIVLAPDGDLYVVDAGNHGVRRVTTAGTVTTYAGSGTAGFADGAPAAARFSSPFGIAAAANGDLIVTDRANYRVRRIVRSGNAAGSVETLAGSGAFTSPGADGTGTAAEIPFPSAVYVRANNAFVRDNSVLVRQIDLTTRVVTTFTGSRALGEGFADGPPTAARFRNGGFGLTGGTAGGLLAADDRGLREIDAAGNVKTIAANNSFETVAGTGLLAQLPFTAAAVAVDSSSRVANYDNVSRAVRRVDAAGNVALAAGLTSGYGGVVDGTGSAAQFGDAGLSIAAAASDVLYVGDSYVLRRIAADGTVTTIAGSTASFGAADGLGGAARFNRLFGLATAPNGDVFVADAGNNAIRRVDTAGNVSTYAGVMGQSSRVDGAVATARLQLPYKVARTPDGTLWFIDGTPGSGVLRKVSADGTTVSSVQGASFAGITTLTAEASGLVYYMVNSNLANSGGLFVYNPVTDSSTLLMTASINQTTVLGSVNPLLPFVGSIAVLGPKRILVSGGTQLLVVTLP